MTQLSHPKYQVIAFIAGIFTLLALSNLIHRVYSTQNTEHLTYTWIFFILTAQTLLMIYGLLNKAYGIYIPALIVIAGINYILYVKWTNVVVNAHNVNAHNVNTNIEKDLINKSILSTFGKGGAKHNLPLWERWSQT
jgi:uncharacterized protein with PQ loop repeat